MVTRDYKCKCGFNKSVKVSIKEEIERICPECGGNLFQDLINNNEVMFANSPYHYNGSFHRHPRKTKRECDFGININ